MTEYTWAQVRNHAIELFGETPGTELEADLLKHFGDQPAHFANLVDTIGKQVSAGKVRSGFAVLRTQLDKPPPNVRATDDQERIRQIRLVETWLNHTGGYIDHQDELIDEVFGPRGRLYLWDDDQTLRDRIIAHWLEQRPRFVQTEQDAEERMAVNAATYQRLRKASRGAPTKEAADEQAMRVHAEVERARLAYLASIAPDPHEPE
jgi:hypothetical protein